MLSIYNKISDYIIVSNYDGEIIFCNESFFNRMNYNREEILKSHISKLIKDGDSINDLIKESADINKTLDFYSNSNEVVKINSHITIENFNQRKHIFIIGKEAQTKLYDMELLEYSDNMDVLDDDLYVNKPFTNILNKKIEESQTKNINLRKTISEELLKDYNRTSIDSKFNSSGSYDADLNKMLNNIGKQILDYTQANGLAILLYDKDKEGLIPFIKLKNSNIHLKNINFIPIEINKINSHKYRDYFNTVSLKDEMSNLSQITINSMDEINYIGSYIIELYDEFIGFIGLSYSNGNSSKSNFDEYMKYICNKIAMIIKNNRLSKGIYIENKKRQHIEKELEQYLNVSVDLVAIVGKDSYLKKISPNWYNSLGWTEEELLSMSIKEIIHPEELDNFKSKGKMDKLDGRNTRNIIRFRHKDGHYIYLEWMSMYISEEEIYVATARDITKNIEMENENRKLEESVHLEMVKNEFFSNISHEFRTPINIILGTMQVINKNIEKNDINLDSLKKYTNYIKQNSYRLLRLVNNLIDISKMDIGMYKLRCYNQNIIGIIEDITLSVADYTKNKKINLIFDTDCEEVITYCDPDKIERIMLNLLSNAIKYTPDNGFIKVNINTTEEEVKVSVKDSGVGISQDKLDVIFDRFGQADGELNRKSEGSGIGLSLVKNLVELHGGEVSANSRKHEGSEFIFTIPIKIDEENSNEDNELNMDRKCKHVERCDIEFSDVYNV